MSMLSCFIYGVSLSSFFFFFFNSHHMKNNGVFKRIPSLGLLYHLRRAGIKYLLYRVALFEPIYRFFFRRSFHFDQFSRLLAVNRWLKVYAGKHVIIRRSSSQHIVFDPWFLVSPVALAKSLRREGLFVGYLFR